MKDWRRFIKDMRIEIRQKKISQRCESDVTYKGTPKSPLFTIFYAVVVNNKRVDSYLKYLNALKKAKKLAKNGEKIAYLRSI